jgi:hypothetical protein
MHVDTSWYKIILSERLRSIDDSTKMNSCKICEMLEKKLHKINLKYVIARSAATSSNA